MAQLTKIRALQIQNATEQEGIVALQIKANAGILTSQLASGANFLQKDGSVAMTGNLVVVPGTNSDHAISKSQLDTAIANAATGNSTATQAIQDEASTRSAADVALGGRIDAVVTDLSGEITARQSNDTTIANSVTAEATARQNADNSLQTSIDNEQATRITAVAAANTAIQAEADARAAAIAALQTSANGLLTGKADLAGNATQVFAVATPTQDSHAANKAYVDGVAQGLDIKQSVRVASTGNLALAGLVEVDNVQLGVGDRVLVKNQADAKENGIYVATGGAWVRADDADNTPGAEFTAGLFVFVEEGDLNSQSGWACSTANTPLYTIAGVPAIEVGSVNISFVQFSGAGQLIMSTGLEKSGNVLAISNTGVAAGSYTKVTVNAQGQTTSGANPTTLAGYGITDAANISGSQTQVFQVQDAAASFDAINKGQLDAAVQSISNSLTTGGNGLAAETTARLAADAILQANITAEIDARGTAVTGEANTRSAADVALQANITAEATSRAGADTTLQNNIDGVTTALNNEITARAAQDVVLDDKITAVNTAINGASTAYAIADGILQSAIDAEATTRSNAIIAANAAIVAEAATRNTNDLALGVRVDGVVTDLATEATTRATAVTNEQTAREAADTTLQNNINSLSTNLNNNYYTSVQVDTRFTDLINAAPAALDTLGEIATALAAGGTTAGAIAQTIADEVTRATTAEGVVQGNVDAVVTDLANEVVRASAIEATLNTDLGQEIANREAADTALSTSISNLATSAAAAVAALTGSLGVERTANDFHIKLAPDSYLTTSAAGLKMDVTVITAARLRVRDPFSGVVDGSNTEFTLSSVPLDGTEQVFYNGLLMYPGAGNDYMIAGGVITFATPPTASDRISINYTAL